MYKRHRLPFEIIQRAVWLYYRFIKNLRCTQSAIVGQTEGFNGMAKGGAEMLYMLELYSAQGFFTYGAPTDLDLDPSG